jgi:hypothetical protein
MSSRHLCLVVSMFVPYCCDPSRAISQTTLVRTLPGHFDVSNEDAQAIGRTPLDSIEGHYKGNADGWVPEQFDKPEEA